MELRRLLGSLHAKVKTGHLVVKSVDPRRRPSLGSKVVDINGNEIGVLVDIIGNVDDPYMVVRVKDKSVAERLKEGSWLYYVAKPERRRRPRRR